MAYETPDHIRQILRTLPTKPGCYLMKDSAGHIIYVGKAKVLKNRVPNYFTQHADHTPKTLKMRSLVADIEIIVTETEVQALILEETLIKQHQPRYNILLKDDKRYPYIRVTWQNPFPKVETTRRVVKDGSRYFGPYAAMWAVQNTLRVLRKAFPYLTCDRTITGNDERACLFWDIGLCSAPCIGKVNQVEYRAMIAELMDVLSGKSDGVLGRLTKAMDAASEALQFERAAVLRDQIKAIEYITQRHRAVSPQMTDHDVIAIARDDKTAVVQILFIRNGKLIGSDHRSLEHFEDESDSEVLEQFLTQFYSSTQEIPREIILPDEVEEARIIERWLSDKRSGAKVQITVPKRGNKIDLIGMARENASEALRMMKAQWEADTTKHEQAMAELQEALNLPNPPNRIECYDISTTQGTAIVASRVVFVQGTSAKGEYRRFNIRTVEHAGSDDYQSMREALTRRFSRWQTLKDEPPVHVPGKEDRDATWRTLPDLLLIDGGKGQLGVAYEVLSAFDLLDKVPVASLAKQFEEIYLPGKPIPVILPRQSQALYLVQRIRDEAHRFAITNHRNRRDKAGMASLLDGVPGIGPNKRKALLAAFGNSISAIRSASVEELAAVKGINKKLAEQIKAVL
ncbi:MAG: excinuclease ABC subunit UvrC [Chloroflexi bacterium]|nr:excinuclease ABC subunit UvrC [Chloroflexota bacterium]MBV6437118.1 UvrABC system protein C [Anaerolineae bacterium]OQY80742.1 MAG: excinuclease ABC subunit C [Anaerolineae bacterium UTCFX5]MCC6565663.1 excinuclease ABC subunit UvrC [Chloroflexota bacterium]MCO6443185.1 excinuclease ABC subunit UvrC [Anaerolineae bacterium]